MKTNEKEIVLYNDCDVDYELYRQEYAELMEDDTILNSADYDSVFYDWVNACLNMYWDSLLDNLKYNKQNGECVVIGNVGRWNGRYDITPHKFDNLQDALVACVKGCDYVKVVLTNGHLEIVGMHHDANNYFNIYLLNKLGRTTENADLNKECYYMKIKDIW